MATKLFVGDGVFEALAGEWDALATRGMTDTPFQTWAYQRAWWTHLRPPDSTLLTVAARDEDDQLAAIGCFFHRDGALHFNGCIEETDYLDLIAPAERAEWAWSAVLDCLERAEPAWTALALCNVPAASPTRAVLPALAQQHGYAVHEEQIEVCPTIPLPETFEAYLESLDSKQRRELSRKLRRAEGAELTTTAVGPAEDVHAAVERFLELLQMSTFEKRDWLNDGRRAVFHEVARAAQTAGTLQLLFCGIEDRTAAALFNFDYRNRIWVYNSGLDPSAFAALSPGVVLTAAAIERAVALGRAEFDFLRGDEEYKYRFGAVDQPIYRLHVSRAG
ncbi:MAG TPA: GNAT family N-acetyltransferase [Promineifilum sp.]|nr:GNAT family N-acetyltransferase [Promineifilum sp.]